MVNKINKPSVVHGIYFLWLVIIAVVGLLDSNVNVLYGFAIWFFGSFFIYMWGSGQYANSRVVEWIFKEFSLYRITDTGWKHLVILSLFTTVIGNGLLAPPEDTITILSPIANRAIHANQLTLHLPIVEKIDYWTPDSTVYDNGVNLTTADGKHITANVFVDVSFSSPIAPLTLAEIFGSEAEFEKARLGAIETEIRDVVSKYTLEQISDSPLLLEDHIGTSLGLDSVGSFWSGRLEFTDIHVTAAKN